MPGPRRPPNQQRDTGRVRLRRKPNNPNASKEAMRRTDEANAARWAEIARNNPNSFAAKAAAGSAPSTGGTPAAPSQPRYGPLMQRAQRDAQLLYGPQILRAQAQQQNAGTYFDQYKADLAKAQQDVAGRYQAAQAAVAPPTVGPAVQGADEGAAGASRAIMQKALEGLLTSQGAAQGDYLTGRQTVGSAQQLQSRTQAGAEVNRLSTEKDTYALSKRDEYRDQAHTRRLENKAFGLDTAKAAADAADKAADNKRQQREDRQRRRDDANKVNAQGYTNAEWSAMTPDERRAANKKWQESGRAPKTPGKGSSKYTASQKSAAQRDIRKAVALVESKPAHSTDYYNQARDALISEKDMDPAIARAAVQLVRDGQVNEAIARVLKRDYGITVKPRGRKGKIVPTVQPNPNIAPGANGQLRPN